MNQLLRLFDLFQEYARKLAGYLPQSGSDLVTLFQKAQFFGQGIELWLRENVGINLQPLLTQLGRVVVLTGTFLLDFIKQIMGRL